MYTDQATRAAAPAAENAGLLEDLVDFIRQYSPLFVLTGAGCSTASGIPDYRDAKGDWKHARPVQYQEFMQHHAVRQRYWLRSMLGWPRIANARPNPAHEALVSLERDGVISELVTQNVDGLHHKAGHQNVVELHGGIARVRCTDCDQRYEREAIQQNLIDRNPEAACLRSDIAPDGDALPEWTAEQDFNIPHCEPCGGILKPDVVFFGESVPKHRVTRAFSSLQRARGMLVVGSSLIIFSGYRFCRFAAEHGIPLAAINLGRTRADEKFELKLEANCVDVLPRIVYQ